MICNNALCLFFLILLITIRLLLTFDVLSRYNNFYRVVLLEDL